MATYLEEVQALTLSTTALLSAVNVKKVVLDAAVENAQTSAAAAAASAKLADSAGNATAALASRDAASAITVTAIAAQVTATTQAVTAATQALLAATAKTAAESARDAALIQAGVYVDEPTGRAAVGDGIAFKVQGSGDIAAFEYRRISAAASEPITAYPASSALDVFTVNAGLLASDLTVETIGTLTPDSATADAGSYWTNHLGRNQQSYLTAVTFRTGGVGVANIIVMDQNSRVIWQQSAVTSAGLNTVYCPSCVVPAGARAFVGILSGGDLRYVGGGVGYRLVASSYGGNVGDTVGTAPDVGATLAIAFTFKSVAETTRKSINGIKSAALSAQAVARYAGESLDALRSSLQPTGLWTSGAPNIEKFETAFDTGTDLQQGAAVRSVCADLIAYTGADKFVFTIFARPTSDGDRFSAIGSDVVVSRTVRTPSQLGLILNASVAAYLEIPVNLFVAEAGTTYHLITECFTSAGAPQVFGTGNVFFSDSRQRRRGWYIAGGDRNAVPDTVQSSIGFVQSVQPATVAYFDDRVTHAEAATAGMTITVKGVLQGDGAARPFRAAITIPASAAGTRRYDVIYIALDSGLIGRQAGTERANDASEFIPAMSSPYGFALFNVRVTPSGVTTVPVWGVSDGESRLLSEAMEKERRRGRLCLPKTLAKIRRGDLIQFAVWSDSIGALQNDIPSRSTPNGGARDRDNYFREAIGGDLVDALPHFSAIQMGRPDDGVGATHIKNSWAWELVKALERTGAAVAYNNFGVASTGTGDAVSGEALTPWGLAVVALNSDLVAIHFGMNELGSDQTAPHLLLMIAALQAAGTEVILMGVPRPQLSYSTFDAWHYTNQVIARVARFTNSAFVPTAALYDDSYIGAIGCDQLDTCCANRVNHPGLLEHRVIGRELVKLVMGAA